MFGFVTAAAHEFAIDRSDEELAAVARRARDRALSEHTAERRAEQLIEILESTKGDDCVGDHSSGRRRDAYPAARVL